MDTLIDAIRLSIANDASVEARTAGVHACRTILAALEAKAGEPLAPTPVAATPLQAIVGALRTMPLDQLLDLAITKLTAVLPPGTEVPPMHAVRIPLAPVAPLGGKSS